MLSSCICFAAVVQQRPSHHSHFIPLRPVVVRRSPYTATVGFGFDIKDLVTNHQFAGQKNTFHVRYTYARVMAGGNFDPSGHPVSSDVYPYFQQVRDGMISYALHYKPADDFYELYGYNIADHVMRSYPQIREI